MYYVIFLVGLVGGLAAALLVRRLRSRLGGAASSRLAGRHVFITGGSKGIGLELAKLVLARGAHVTLVARHPDDLERAKLALIKRAPSPATQHVQAYSVDVGDSSSAGVTLERIIVEAEHRSGPISTLACCAGTAIAKTFEATSGAEFRQMMDVNYFGTVATVKAALGSLKRHGADGGGGGQVLLFSSLAGLFGLYGYAAYAASKFALVGFAEVLQMELRPHRISVTVAFPPDTDTPGYEREQVGKPEITKRISEEGGLVAPAVVAEKALADTLAGEFVSSVGLNGFVLTSLCAGMMPTRSWALRVAQVATMSLLRVVGLHFLSTCERTVLKMEKEGSEEKKKEEEKAEEKEAEEEKEKELKKAK